MPIMFEHDFLIKIVKDSETEEVFAYINTNNDTIIPFGKYQYSFTDTITDLGIVIKPNGLCIGIDKKDKELFEIYWFDNGPDYIKNGLFRIKKEGKIGYANMKGEIIIEPQFKCANAFENDKAQVAIDCNLIPDGEYMRTESDNWFFIDKTGKKIN